MLPNNIRETQRWASVVFTCLIVTMITLPYQNCSRVGFSSSNNGDSTTKASTSTEGGEGFDGKLYQSYSVCGQAVAVSDIVKLSADFSQATVVRENCQDLSPAKSIPALSLQFVRNDQSVFSYKGKVFDQKVAQQQKLTLSVCGQDTVQTTIWDNLDGTGQLFGRLTSGKTTDTGVLRVSLPDTRYHYMTEPGQASRFDLNLNGPLSYSVGGGATTSLPLVSCSTQSPPLSTNFAATPGAAATGVPAAVTLTASGALTVSTPGTVIDGMNISGQVNINANNVTIKNSKITAGQFWVIKTAAGVTGTVIQDCEIDGGASGTYGIYGAGTFLRNNIHGVDNGMVITGDSLIQDNYIHDMSGTSTSTYCGIRADGPLSNLVIRHNTVIDSATYNGVVMISSYYGAVTSVLIENNRLVGAATSVYLESKNGYPFSGAIVQNNRLGSPNYKVITGNTPVWTGNVDDTTGAPAP